MTDKEKKILEALDTAASDVKIPESLEPDKMKEKLEGVKQKVWKRSYSYWLAAACLAVVIGGAAIYQQMGGADGLLMRNSSSGRGGTDEEVSVGSTIASAKDYDEVFQYFERYEEAISRSSGGSGFLGDTVNENASADRGEAKMESSSADRADTGAAPQAYEGSEGSYSDTNVRTEGVGEADIVKTDGNYLYALKESAAEIAIVDPSGDDMKKIGSISPERGAQISEFYVAGDQLFVLCNIPKTNLNENEVYFYYGEDATLLTYDISDRENPKLTAKLSQSGRYLTSRFVDGYLYLFSSFTVEGDCRSEDIDSYIPMVNGKSIAGTDIFLPPMNTANQYTVVTSVKADKPDEIVDQKAVLAENGQCYVSGSNIYIYESIWRNARFQSLTSGGTTAVRRISYADGMLKGEAQGKVKGYVNDSFSIDEYDGYLRIVTTINAATNTTTNTTNAVYVLDEDLKTVGKITDLAKDERVYSARLLGKTGYFVTYRQTDPLFSVDFSDPKNPQITGELKIPGFSQYLHLYDDGLLLGIGMDTEEESGVTNGVKLSMFDISDPADVKEVQKYTIKGAYSSDVFNDYRAVLIDKERNMIGFSTYGNSEMYYIFSYDRTNGFHQEMEEEVNGMSYMGTRGVYIKDKLYVVKGNAIESYRIGDYTKVDDILL